jgi:hypothetical protein
VRLSRTGTWYGYVSLPLFQFLLLRWYFRLFIWARLLWQVSRLDLRLEPLHPDRVGGLGFLTNTVYAFTPLSVAHGALLAGLIANRIFYLGATLLAFKLEIAVLVLFLLCIMLGPLLVFAPQLAGEADGHSRVWHAGPAVRARVRGQMAARRRACRGVVGGEQRHPVPRRSGQ